MKYKESLHYLCTSVLAFFLGYGCAACLATGLNLPVNMLFLALGCAAGALVAGSCLALRHGTLVLGGLSAALLLLMALSKQFWQQFRATCFIIATHFNRSYGTPVPQWIDGQTSDNQILPLLLIAGLVMIITSWTVARRKGSFPAILAALLPLTGCILIPDTLPDLPPLFLLIAGSLLLVLTRFPRQQDACQASLLTMVLLVPVGAALIGLMLLIPPGTQGSTVIYSSVDSLLGWLDQKAPGAEQAGPGNTDTSTDSNPNCDVDLSKLGTRPERTNPVMKITTNYSGLMYLRSRDYDAYSGLGWLSTQDRSEEDFGLALIWRDSPEFVSFQVLTPRDQYYLPCYPTKNHTFAGGTLPNPERSVNYTYSFSPLRSDWKNLWHQYNKGAVNTPQVPAAGKQYLALPEETRLRAQALLSSLKLQKAPTAVDKADVICKYVSSGAVYSNTPSQMPRYETDFSMWFLEDGDAGYCVHFASAATVLLRAAGIPARYVEGYLVRTQGGQETIVQERMAHAWVEYHLDYIGWVIMDPTPEVSGSPSDETDSTEPPTITTDPPETTEPEETTPSTTAPSEPTDPEDPSVTTPSDTPPSITTPSTTAPGHTPGESDPSNPTVLVDENSDKHPGIVSEWMQNFLRSIIWIGAAVLAVAAQWLLRRWFISIWLHRGTVNAQALKQYRYIKYVARLCMLNIPDDLISLTEKAAYSQHQLNIDELKPFDNFTRECIQTIRKRPWYRRLILRFIFAVY